MSAVSGEPLRVTEEFGEVSAVIPDAAGGWYAGGPRHLHRIRPDGRVDPAFSVTIGEQDRIDGLVLSPDGATLWLAGYFDRVNGEIRGGIAAVDAATGQLRPWRGGEEGDSGGIALSPDGRTVYVAGTYYDERDFRAVIALDTTTGALRAYGPVGAGITLALAPDGGTVYLLDAYDDVVYALDAGTLAQRWRVPAAGFDPLDLALTPDGSRLFVTDLARFGTGLIQLDTATGARTSFSVPIKSAGPIALSPDGETAYVGRAQITGWPQIGGVAFATRDGALLGWAPGANYGYSIDDLAVSRDGAEVFLDGAPTVATRMRFRTAVLDETGMPTAWTEPARTETITDVASAVLDASGTAYFARSSDYSPPRDSVTAVAWDGALRWRADLGGGGAAVTLSPDERTLYLTGTFTSVGGVARPGLAALRASDGALEPWSFSVSGGNVTGMLFSPDGGTFYVKGTFTAVNGVPRAGLAAVDAATGTVLPFNPAPGRVTQMRLSADGSMLYVSGEFPDSRYLLGFRVADGARVFAPDIRTYVRSFVPLADGQTVMVAASYHDHMIGNRALTAWDVASSTVLPWHAEHCACDVVTLALDPDGRTLHAGGDIIWAGRRHYYLRLAVSRPPAAPVNTAPPRVAGAAQPGRFVECDPGTWSGHPSEYRYAWTLNGATVPGFGGRELLLTAADAGRSVACQARAGSATACERPGGRGFRGVRVHPGAAAHRAAGARRGPGADAHADADPDADRHAGADHDARADRHARTPTATPTARRPDRRPSRPTTPTPDRDAGRDPDGHPARRVGPGLDARSGAVGRRSRRRSARRAPSSARS